MAPKSDTRVEYDAEEAPSGEPGLSPGEAKRLLQAAKSAEQLRARMEEALEKGRQPGVRRGGRFRYSWEDLAQALGKSPRTVQRWAREGRFDPRDFASVVRLLREG